MNEFISKKLGEVLAFAEVFDDTLQRGRGAIKPLIGDESFQALVEENNNHIETIKRLATEAMEEVTLGKAEKTGSKLRSMRDMYIGDEWDNITELLEWSGFFEGAAIVHWSLVEGAAESIRHEELKEISHQAISFHRSIFERANEEIKKIAKSNS